jgi:hypothetical protein
MSTIKSEYASGTKPMPIPAGQEVVNVYVEVTLTAAQVALNNVVQLLKLPADCVPVGYAISNADLDSNGAPTLTADFGILNEAGTAISIATADGGDEWLDGSTAVQSASLTLHTANKTAYDALRNVESSDEDRIVALVFATAAATAAGGTIGVELSYRSAQ